MKPEEVQALVNRTVADATRQFSEQLRQVGEQLKPLGETITTLRTELTAVKQGREEDRTNSLRREFNEFLMQPDLQRRISEGQRPATIDHLIALSSAPPLEFGEGDQKKTVSAVDDYKAKLLALPEVVAFGEYARRDRMESSEDKHKVPVDISRYV